MSQLAMFEAEEAASVLPPAISSPPEGRPGALAAADVGIPTAAAAPVNPLAAAQPRTTCDKCGSTRRVDVRIHAGRSLRRDCAWCGRFLGWPKWDPCSPATTGVAIP